MSNKAGMVSGSAPSLAASHPVRSLDRVLFELSMSEAVTGGNVEESLHEICSAAAKALDVRHTNVWVFDGTHSALSEIVTFPGDRTPCATLATASNPAYFAALQQQRVIASEDVATDPRTAGFCAGYFHPRGITATLDAPVRLHGRLLGVLCHEHCGGPRRWDAEEERFAASLADLVALALVADERAKALNAVRESEARFRCLVDGVRDLIFEIDPVGTIISVNRAIERLLGFAPDAWIGRHVAGLIAPGDEPRVRDLFARILAGREASEFEIRLRHAAGHFVRMEFVVSIERVAGELRGVLGVGRDVTARRQRDAHRRVLVAVGQALARGGDELGGAIDVIHEQLADALDADVLVTALVEPGSTAQATLRQHVAPGAAEGPDAAGDAATSRQLAEQALALRETAVLPLADDAVALACPLLTPVGTLGAVVARRIGAADAARSLRDRQSRQLPRSGSTPFSREQVDLLDRVGRELALALAAARHRREAATNAALSAALARVGQALITSLDLPVLLEHLCRVTTEVMGCDTAYTFLRDDDLGGFVRAAAYGDPPQVDEALRAVPVLDSQTPGLRDALERDGVLLLNERDDLVPEAFWTAYGTRSCMVIALRHGTRVVGALALAHRSASAAFGPQQVRMAHGIAQLASLAIANARLVGELEAAGRIKSDFVATMSHELRTPLNVILGYTDLLLLDEFGPLMPQQADAVRRVHANAAGLHELIEATLDLSRLETGSVALRLEDVDLNAWLAEVRAETTVQHERNPSVDVRFTLSGATAPVRCDALKLKVIVKNLIGNALKFTAEGSVDVDVTVDAASLAITVRDTGIGIAPEVQTVIFEPFRQGDASSTRPYGGVGLGLYIVRRLVEALRGRIFLDSAPGRGSEFRVEIPLDRRTQ